MIFLTAWRKPAQAKAPGRLDDKHGNESLGQEVETTATNAVLLTPGSVSRDAVERVMSRWVLWDRISKMGSNGRTCA
jgi:hypothetical protein